MRAVKRILSTLFLLFAIAVFIYGIYITVKADKTGEEIFFFGYKPYIIQTGSMEPAIKVNSLVIVKQGGFDEIKVGDVISFKMRDKNINVCHRVIEKNGDEFVTKGDNNNSEDLERVLKDKYIGKVVFSTNLTAFVIAFLSKPSGWISLAIFIIAIIVAVVSVKVLFSKEGKRLKKKEDRKEQKDTKPKSEVENIEKKE